MSSMKESENLRIPFEDIKVATKNFKTIIGRGGYGHVYKGELILSGHLTSVAVKRLPNTADSGQGLKEFLTEIHLLSRYEHPNLVSLLGYCEEGNEKILIYEYAERGSFDNYLKAVCSLTWKQRINICIDAARGLDYLHNRVGENQRVIHRDIKSANILLDNNWKAKISDLGLSKIGRANEDVTYLITNVGGTLGYCDPVYIKTGILTKKSDVYSFGVVLFEALCGMLCFMNVTGEQRHLVPLARRCYEKGKLDEIMDLDLMSSESVEKFAEIAYQCLHDDQERRPSMGEVLQMLEGSLESLESEELQIFLAIQKREEELRLQVLRLQELDDALEMQKLEEALELYKLGDMLDLEKDYAAVKAMHTMTTTRPRYTTKAEIYEHLSSGILVDDGNVWVSIDENGTNQEMISAIKFMPQDPNKCVMKPWCNLESRLSYRTFVFSKGAKIFDASKINIQVKIRPQFLSSNVRYTAYFLCEHTDTYRGECSIQSLQYKINNQSDISYPRYFSDNGLVMIELFQTNGPKKNVEFEILLEEFQLDSKTKKDDINVQGIVFLRIQKFDEDNLKTKEVENIQTSGWRDLIPPYAYENFVLYTRKGKAEGSQNTGTNEDEYAFLCEGIYVDVKYETDVFFWLTRNGKKCFMLSPKSINEYDEDKLKLIHPNELSFEHVLELESSARVRFGFRISESLLSTKTRYAAYLVYKMPESFVDRVYVEIYRQMLSPTQYYRDDNCYTKQEVYLSRFECPVIGPDGTGEGFVATPRINNRPISEFPAKRKDGWLEVNLWQFSTQDEPLIHKLYSWFSTCIPWFGLTYETDRDFSHCTLLSGYDYEFSIHMSCQDYRGNAINIPNLSVQGIEFRPI